MGERKGRSPAPRKFTKKSALLLEKRKYEEGEAKEGFDRIGLRGRGKELLIEEFKGICGELHKKRRSSRLLSCIIQLTGRREGGNGKVLPEERVRTRMDRGKGSLMGARESFLKSTRALFPSGGINGKGVQKDKSKEESWGGDSKKKGHPFSQKEYLKGGKNVPVEREADGAPKKNSSSKTELKGGGKRES